MIYIGAIGVNLDSCKIKKNRIKLQYYYVDHDITSLSEFYFECARISKHHKDNPEFSFLRHVYRSD
jgi:hypothetical protein